MSTETDDRMTVQTGVVVTVDDEGGATITPIGCDPDEAVEIICALARGMARTDRQGMTLQ